jgi:Mg-chelatase subunit ChlD
MPVRKLSVALEDETATAVAAAAARRGVSLSSWLNEAAEHALHVEAGLRAVAEWEAEHGAFTDGELAEADRFLAHKRRRRAS